MRGRLGKSRQARFANSAISCAAVINDTYILDAILTRLQDSISRDQGQLLERWSVGKKPVDRMSIERILLYVQPNTSSFPTVPSTEPAPGPIDRSVQTSLFGS